MNKEEIGRYTTEYKLEVVIESNDKIAEDFCNDILEALKTHVYREMRTGDYPMKQFKHIISVLVDHDHFIPGDKLYDSIPVTADYFRDANKSGIWASRTFHVNGWKRTKST